MNLANGVEKSKKRIRTKDIKELLVENNIIDESKFTSKKEGKVKDNAGKKK